MSASLYYKPTSFTGTSIPAFAPQAFMEMLEAAFGTKAPVLNGHHVAIINAMSIATCDPQMKKCFEALLKGIEKHEEIEVYAVY